MSLRCARPVALVIVVVLFVGACGESGATSGAATATSTAVEVVATEVPQSAEASATEAPAPSPTAVADPAATEVSEPEPTATPEPVDEEAAIRAVHTRFMTELFARDDRIVGRDSHLPLIEELTVDPQNKRLKDFILDLEGRGLYSVGPGYDSNISEVEIIGDRATVFDCSQGRGEGWSEDGELVVEADDFWKWRNTKLVRIDGVWFVEDFITGGEIRCDPDTFADL